MIVRQHDEGGTGRRVAHHLFRHRRQSGLTPARKCRPAHPAASRRRSAAPATAQMPPPAHGRHGRRRRSAHAVAWHPRPWPLAAAPRALPGRPARSPPRPGRRSIGRSRGRAGCRGEIPSPLWGGWPEGRVGSQDEHCVPPHPVRRCRPPSPREEREHFPCPVDRHEFELAAADGSVDRAGRDQHPCALLARRRAFSVRHFDEGHGGRSVEEGAKAFRGGGHGRKTITAEYPMLRRHGLFAPPRLRSRSTAISTRSGVAGASRRGQIR